MKVGESDREAEELTTKQVIDLYQQIETLYIKHELFDNSLAAFNWAR